MKHWILLEFCCQLNWNFSYLVFWRCKEMVLLSLRLIRLCCGSWWANSRTWSLLPCSHFFKATPEIITIYENQTSWCTLKITSAYRADSKSSTKAFACSFSWYILSLSFLPDDSLQLKRIHAKIIRWYAYLQFVWMKSLELNFT